VIMTIVAAIMAATAAATAAAIVGAIVAAIAGVADAHRLTVLRRPGDRRRPFRDDPEGAEFQLERWCSIGKT
jgi:hypothetical protein